MDYPEFRQKVLGKLITPDEDLIERLVEGADSIHFIVVLGTIQEGKFTITVPEYNMNLFLHFLELIESRGARKDIDFFVAGNKYPNCLTIEIHTTHSFLSQEDIPDNVKQYWKQK